MKTTAKAAPAKPRTARDQLVGAISARMLAAGASFRATVGTAAIIAGWARDEGISDPAVEHLARRLQAKGATSR